MAFKKGKKAPPAPSTAPKHKTPSVNTNPHSSGKIPGAKLAGLLGMMGQGGGPGGPPGPMQSPAAGPNPQSEEGGFSRGMGMGGTLGGPGDMTSGGSIPQGPPSRKRAPGPPKLRGRAP